MLSQLLPFLFCVCNAASMNLPNGQISAVGTGCVGPAILCTVDRHPRAPDVFTALEDGPLVLFHRIQRTHTVRVRSAPIVLSQTQTIKLSLIQSLCVF